MNQDKKERSFSAQENTRPTIKGILQSFIVIVICLLLYVGMNEVLRAKAGDNNIMIDPSLRSTPWDVVFVGSSHANNAIYPMQIWEEHGFLTYNNAQSGQILPFTYYACRSLIKRYQPKVIVLDLYMLYHKRATGNDKWAHQTIDTLNIVDRIAASLHVVQEDQQKEFLLPMTLYHTRWKELTPKDFAGRTTPLLKGSQFSMNRAEELHGIPYQITPADVVAEPAEIPVYYLNKIIDLCKETNTELVLMVLPYLTSPETPGNTHDMSKDEAYFNWAGQLAAEKGLHFINYFHLREELGINWVDHFKDYSHMNYWGGEIITRHLGQYLSDHFDFIDRRSDPAYEQWNKDLIEYHAHVANKLAEAQ